MTYDASNNNAAQVASMKGGEMKIDFYTKAVLTVIAGCLVYFIMKDVSVVQEAAAQAQPVLNQVQKEVRAEEFVLVDTQCQSRARLGMLGTDGIPSLSLMDAQGKHRVMLLLSSDGYPALNLEDAQGRRKLVTPE